MRLSDRRGSLICRLGNVIALALFAAVAGGCVSNSPSPAASECLDKRAPGAVPDLEALLPRGMIERSPDVLDSGVNCSLRSLGTYASHGIAALRFAGATWDQGGGDATVVAILQTADTGPVLEAAWVEEFYETGARASSKTENIEITRPTMSGVGEVYRLETLNDLSLQTVVIWPAEPRVHVVIVATTVTPDASRGEHNQLVEIAVEVAAGVPIP